MKKKKLNHYCYCEDYGQTSATIKITILDTEKRRHETVWLCKQCVKWGSPS